MKDVRPTIIYGANSAFAVRTFLLEHLRFFSDSGFRVIAVFPRDAGPVGSLLDGLRCAEEYRVTLRREVSPIVDVISIVQLWWLIRKARPAIVNMTTPKMGLLGTLAAALAGVPVRIYTLRGLRLETTQGLKRSVLTWAERIACRASSVVVCISESLRNRALELGIVDSPKAVLVSKTISEGVELARYRPTEGTREAATALRRRLDIADPTFILGFVGRLTRDKGICELVAAFRSVRDRSRHLKLVLVGEFEPGDPVPTAVANIIRDDPDILAFGYREDVERFYHLMDVLVLPTYREGLGKVLIEAAAAGKPVIASGTTGVIDVVRHGQTGLLVPPRDEVALAEAIDRFVSDREYTRKLGEAALSVASIEFDGNERMESLALLYSQWTCDARDFSAVQERPRPPRPGVS